jgi:hypothetical protein
MKNKLKGLAKIIAFSAIGLAALQFCTFHLFAKRAILPEINTNIESMVLEHNHFDSVLIISDYEFSNSQLKSDLTFFSDLPSKYANENYFEKAEPDTLKLTYTIILNEIKPFGISKIYEQEFVKGFMCDWNSIYVWVLFDWVFIEKKMNSIT